MALRRAARSSLRAIIGVIVVMAMVRMTRMTRVATRIAARATAITMGVTGGGTASAVCVRSVRGWLCAVLQFGSVVVTFAGIAGVALNPLSKMGHSRLFGLCLPQCREIQRNIASLGAELGITSMRRNYQIGDFFDFLGVH